MTDPVHPATRLLMPFVGAFLFGLSAAFAGYFLSVGLHYQGVEVAGMCSAGGFVIGAAYGMTVPQTWLTRSAQVTQPVIRSFRNETPQLERRIYEVHREGNYLSVDVVNIPIDFEKLRKVSVYLSRGKSYSYASLSHILTRSEHKKLQEYMERRNYLVWIDPINHRSGVALTPEGEQFLADVRTSPTAPSRYQFGHGAQGLHTQA